MTRPRLPATGRRRFLPASVAPTRRWWDRTAPRRAGRRSGRAVQHPRAAGGTEPFRRPDGPGAVLSPHGLTPHGLTGAPLGGQNRPAPGPAAFLPPTAAPTRHPGDRRATPLGRRRGEWAAGLGAVAALILVAAFAFVPPRRAKTGPPWGRVGRAGAGGSGLSALAVVGVVVVAVIAVAIAVAAAPAGAADAGPAWPARSANPPISSARPARSPTSSARPDPARRVVIVSIPRLGWEDVTPASMPTLVALADRGAVASLSVKTIGRRTTPVEGYASMATGTRATAPEGAQASGYAPTERMESGRRAAAEMRASGHDPRSARVLVPGIDAVTAFNRSRHEGAETGALGRALHAGGSSTAVIVNHDGPRGTDRSAAVALADPAGRVDLGSVSSALIRRDGPLRRTDPDAVARRVAALPDTARVTLVEIGDVDWADDAHAAPGARRAAVRSADRVLARVLATLDRTHDLVLAMSPAAPVAFERPTPFVMAGPGAATGLARSATTRRPGYVTLPDIGPTVVAAAGSATPSAMSGTPITSIARTGTGADRVAAAREAIAETRFTDRAAGKFLVSYPIVFASWSFLILLGLVIPVASLRRLLGGFALWLGVVISVVPVLAFPLGSVTARAWHLPIWFTVLWLIGMAVGASALLVAVRVLAPRMRPAGSGPWLAVAVTAAITYAVLVVDVLTGGRLQFDTPLGNSPTGAGRFTGMGNLAFGLLASATLLLAWTVATELTRRGRRAAGVIAAAAIFVVAVVVDGAPSLGSDVGGALVLAPVGVASCWLLAGRRVSWRLLAAAVASGAVAVAVFGAVDLTRPPDHRTHLGRLLAGDGGGREIIIRKAIDVGGSFEDSSLVWIVFCTLVLAAAFWWLRRAEVRATFALGGAARPLVGVAVFLGIAGGALNDSGVMVPAIMAGVLVPAAVAALVAGEVGGRAT